MLPIPLDALSVTGIETPIRLDFDAGGGDPRTGFLGLIGIALGEGLRQPPDLELRLQRLLPPELLLEVEAAIAGGMSLPELANWIRPQLQQLDAGVRTEVEHLLAERVAPHAPQAPAVAARPALGNEPRPVRSVAVPSLADAPEPAVVGLVREPSVGWRSLPEGVVDERIGSRLPLLPTEAVRVPAASGADTQALPRVLLPELPMQGVLPDLQRPVPLPASAQTPPQVPVRLGDTGWSQALADRVTWLVGRGQQVADLRLNPPNLGPLEVKVSVHQDQASVTFVSQHAVVREAVEAALPRLREMFGHQDLQLVQVEIGNGEPGSGRPRTNPESRHGTDGGAPHADEPEAVADARTDSSESVGLIDIYA